MQTLAMATANPCQVVSPVLTACTTPSMRLTLHEIEDGVGEVVAEGRTTPLIGHHPEALGAAVDLASDGLDEIPATVSVEPGGSHHEVSAGTRRQFLAASLVRP